MTSQTGSTPVWHCPPHMGPLRTSEDREDNQETQYSKLLKRNIFDIKHFTGPNTHIVNSHSLSRLENIYLIDVFSIK